MLGAVKKLADGRLCSTGPMEHAIPAALNGDRSHEATFRAALRERADLTVTRLNAIDGIHTVAPTAAFYAMPRVSLPPGVTDEDYVLGAAARDRRAVRLRIRLRHETRGRLLPRRLSRRSRGAVATSTISSPTSPATSSRAAAASGSESKGVTTAVDSPEPKTRGADPLRHRDDGAAPAILLWCAYIVRHALLIVYVSALFAIGFSPIVRVIERQRLVPIAKRLPRWLAILILYLAILGTVALVLVADLSAARGAGAGAVGAGYRRCSSAASSS